MNLTQFFETSIKLQKNGYKICSIEQNVDGKFYFVRFAYGDVAFGGVQYEIQFYNDSTQLGLVNKMVVKKLKLEFEISEKVSTIDKAVDSIIAVIQKLEGERQRILSKLSQREKELLGI